MKNIEIGEFRCHDYFYLVQQFRLQGLHIALFVVCKTLHNFLILVVSRTKRTEISNQLCLFYSELVSSEVSKFSIKLCSPYSKEGSLLARARLKI